MIDRQSLLRLLNPIRQCIALIVRRCEFIKIKDGAPVQIVQAKLFKGEVRDQVERLQDYGMSSVPLPGCKALAVCAGGECGHETVIKADDRRYRPRNLDPGDVMFYTKSNKCCGEGEPGQDDPDTEHHIHLCCECREVRMRGKKTIIDMDEEIVLKAKRIRFIADEFVEAETPELRGTEEVKDKVRTMQEDRYIYNDHGHLDASPPPSPAQ